MELVLPGLPAGFYASLAAVNVVKIGTALLPDGRRIGLLRNSNQQVLTVLAINNRNAQGDSMQLTLNILAG